MNLLSSVNLIKITVFIIALICPSYHLYHELIANDVMVSKNVTIIKKTAIDEQRGNTSYHFTYQDKDMAVTTEQVYKSTYESTPLDSIVTIRQANIDIHDNIIILAYIEYVFAIFIGLNYLATRR